MTAAGESGELYGPHALPYGVVSRSGGARSLCVRLGDTAVQVGPLARQLGSDLADVLDGGSLDPLLAAGPDTWRAARSAIQNWLTEPSLAEAVRQHTVAIEAVDLQLPFTVADYVDFYSSKAHAENVSTVLRPGQPLLHPNWLHLPIGYHGRAGTVVPSGTPVTRPRGQLRSGVGGPRFGATERLDVEVELGFVVGNPTALGRSVTTAELEDHVFGVVLVNDWSARDIQAWEYVPLGPFLAKSFATSVGAWVLPLAALEHARVPAPARIEPIQPYLRSTGNWGLDIQFELRVNGAVISRPNYRDMYWTPDQQLAHLTVNGAALRAGDLFASGTVSGPERDTVGSLIEATHDGTAPIQVGSQERGYLRDGDSVTITATAPGPAGRRVGLGSVDGLVVPARAVIAEPSLEGA